jgi:hypothetical protein
MYGISTLKTRRPPDPTGVICPVRGCRHTVAPQPALLRLTAEFKCPAHKLFLSETVCAHEKETDNVLWSEGDHLRLLREARGSRPAPTLGSESSEDALSWNVFRWLEASGSLPALLERWVGRPAYGGVPLYWGYDRERERVWDALRHTRSAFAEPDDDLTAPRVLVSSDELLVLVAARAFSAGFRRQPGRGPSERWPDYETGASAWADEVLAGPCGDLVAEPSRYELLRLWLVGSRRAHALERDFFFVHLVPQAWSEGALGELLPRLRQGAARQVVQATWEEVHGFIAEECSTRPGATVLLSYLEEKSAGYDRQGRLRRAFSLARAPLESVIG